MYYAVLAGLVPPELLCFFFVCFFVCVIYFYLSLVLIFLLVFYIIYLCVESIYLHFTGTSAMFV